MQRAMSGAAHLVFGLFVGAAHQQQPRDLQLAFCSGDMQRRPASLHTTHAPQRRAASVSRRSKARQALLDNQQARTFRFASLLAPRSSSSSATRMLPSCAAQ